MHGSGPRGEEGIYLGEKGVEALRAILHLPGSEALPYLEDAPLERLFFALKHHAEEALGPLRPHLRSPQNYRGLISRMV